MIVELKNEKNSVEIGRIKKDVLGQLFGWRRYFDVNCLDEVLDYLIEEYNTTGCDLCPGVRDMLKPFDHCSPWNLKVIIVGEEPKASKIETFHTPFGQELGKEPLSTSLRMFQNSIDKTINETGVFDTKRKIDPTLKDWLTQGILVINSSPTVLWGLPGSHADLWYFTMRSFFEKLSTDLNDLAFVFLGDNACRYSSFINKNKNHLIIMDKLPSYYSDRSINHVYNFFKDIDVMLYSRFNEVVFWNERIDKTRRSNKRNGMNYCYD